MAGSAPSAHAHWSSRFAFIMAAVGSAVGLGNLWGFPFRTGANGGSAFVLVYIACVVFIAFPVLIAELSIGRHAQKSAVSSTRNMAREAGRSGNWSIVGWIGMIAGFLILTTYSVIAGQVMAFSAAGFAGGFGQEEMPFMGSNSWSMFWHFAFMFITVLVVSRGLKGGIERVVTILMPLFFILLAALTVYALITGEAGQAFAYLFQPDFSQIDGGVFVSALGQAFFSVGVASAIMVTYGSYLNKDANIASSSVIICTADTLVALVAGLMIFPIVFSFGLDPAVGFNLIFEAIPNVFVDMPFGNIIGGAFFFLAFIAALTSSISLLEATVAFVEEHSDFGRMQAALLFGGFAFLIGAGAVYSQEFAANFIDLISNSILLPLGGFLVAVFAGWVVPKSLMREELSHASGAMFGFFHIMIRYIVPIAVGLILILGLDSNFFGGRLNALLGIGG